MNFELKHMKALQEQKDKILRVQPGAFKLDPWSTRLSRYMTEGCTSVFCDTQSVILMFLTFASFVFWVVCHLVKDKSGETTS